MPKKGLQQDPCPCKELITEFVETIEETSLVETIIDSMSIIFQTALEAVDKEETATEPAEELPEGLQRLAAQLQTVECEEPQTVSSLVAIFKEACLARATSSEQEQLKSPSGPDLTKQIIANLNKSVTMFSCVYDILNLLTNTLVNDGGYINLETMHRHADYPIATIRQTISDLKSLSRTTNYFIIGNHRTGWRLIEKTETPFNETVIKSFLKALLEHPIKNKSDTGFKDLDDNALDLLTKIYFQRIYSKPARKLGANTHEVLRSINSLLSRDRQACAILYILANKKVGSDASQDNSRASLVELIEATGYSQVSISNGMNVVRKTLLKGTNYSIIGNRSTGWELIEK